MTCVPCPCDLLGVNTSIEEILCIVKLMPKFQDPPRLGQLYSAAYTASTHVPEVIDGIPQILQRDLTGWFLKFSIAFVLPWMIMFMVIIVILGRNDIIRPGTVYSLMLLVLFLSLLAFAFVYWQTTGIVSGLGSQIKNKFDENWKNNKTPILNDILDSYENCTWCSSKTPGCSGSCGGTCSGVCPS